MLAGLITLLCPPSHAWGLSMGAETRPLQGRSLEGLQLDFRPELHPVWGLRAQTFFRLNSVPWTAEDGLAWFAAQREGDLIAREYVPLISDLASLRVCAEAHVPLAKTTLFFGLGLSSQVHASAWLGRDDASVESSDQLEEAFSLVADDSGGVPHWSWLSPTSTLRLEQPIRGRLGGYLHAAVVRGSHAQYGPYWDSSLGLGLSLRSSEGGPISTPAVP